MSALSTHGVLGCGRNQSVDIACYRAGKQTCNCRGNQHERNVQGKSGNDKEHTEHRRSTVTEEVDFPHSLKLLYQERRNCQTDDHRHHLRCGECTQHSVASQHVSAPVCTNAGDTSLDVHQHIEDSDHDKVLVLKQQLQRLHKGNLLVHTCGCSCGKFLRRQLLYGEYGDRVYDQSDDSVDNCHVSPSCRAAAESSRKTYRYRGYHHVGSQREHETDGPHLHSLVGILRDQRGQRSVSDVVGGVEDYVQQHVHDEEVCVLCCLSHSHRHREQQHQTDAVTDLGPQHPGTGFTHLGVGLIHQVTEDDIGDTVKDSCHCDQHTNHTGVQSYCVSQIDHYEAGNQTVDTVGSQVARSVSDFVVPF